MTQNKGIDDPWERLARANQAESRGEDQTGFIVGDTDGLLRREPAEVVEIEGPGPQSEMLQLVNDSLQAAPERADLWMMRFDMQRALGLKDEFAAALVAGSRHPRLVRQLDWSALRAMWQELAPGAALPAGIVDPTAVGEAPEVRRPGAAVTPAGTAKVRRFADVAVQIAGAELRELAAAYAELRARPDFYPRMVRTIAPLLKRPTPLVAAGALAGLHGGRCRFLLKREDLRTLTPELENATAQCYLARELGRHTAITANDVDAHALAFAVVARRFDLKPVIVVRPEDAQEKAALVARLRGFGAQVEPAPAGMLSADPREGALRLWQRAPATLHLVLSLGTAPSPYPSMVQTFQALLGRETELQYRALADGRPRTLVAAVGSEADAIGFMLPFLSQQSLELVLAEPEPGGVAAWPASARLRAYNGAVREHAWLHALRRTQHVAIPDGQAQAMKRQLAAAENVDVSLEDARAVALAALLAQRHREPHDYVVLVAR